MQVRDLIERLQTFPPEMRLEFSVKALKGDVARADACFLRLSADVVELQLTGALVRSLEIVE